MSADMKWLEDTLRRLEDRINDLEDLVKQERDDLQNTIQAVSRRVYQLEQG